MSMSISILGQSNSILKAGFFQKFLDADDTITVKSAGRIGASPSLLGPYFAQGDFFQGSEFCIVDPCVIDFSLLSANAIDYYDVLKWIEWIGHSAKRANCEPVFVCIPVSDINASRTVISACISVCQKNDWYYLDVRDIIATVAKSRNVDAKELYADGSHPAEFLSGVIATHLGNFLTKIRTAKTETCKRTFAFTAYERVSLREQIQSAPVDYSSRLIAFSGVRLARGERYPIYIGSDASIRGLMVNSAACKSVLTIEGDRTFHKNLRLKPYHPTNFEARLIPICKPIRDHQGGVTLSLTNQDVRISDVTMHSFKEDNDEGFIEAADLVVERGYDLITYAATRPADPASIRWMPD
ncbi:hypothetical protein [Bradyrhizobium sp. Ce-3]|uniref:hypothetical protein n=1 Tax=Bradyrhizobium sp. Ce-3 TaxID=2913970 RepID=UPI001FB9561E|nr:hypothetical protein [Bradyrhizobium sp. Ce-3]GKQ49704.1 hypothetical protein BRSPCE3_05580 [Bradyrhizobium sp. Ce-3]